VTQLDLYSSVAPPLLDSFLNGFNATILAYGQTGSGKTYTMGSEAGTIDETNFLNGNVSDNIGLIPRFISDMFESLFRRREASEKASLRKTASHQSISLVDFRVFASFLEVYGEDIFDLLDENRNALKVREDSNKEVVIVGLKQVHIHNSVDAMNILNTGTMNRTTAATLMNFTSSRSHACFTVNLQQTTRSADGDDVTTTSRFTFVDLAGSERMKKTGAEGARAKEGIKINEGLLALGNVINALADEERLAKGERVHVVRCAIHTIHLALLLRLHCITIVTIITAV
jgi:kinesin family protein 4/21/27